MKLPESGMNSGETLKKGAGHKIDFRITGRV